MHHYIFTLIIFPVTYFQADIKIDKTNPNWKEEREKYEKEMEELKQKFGLFDTNGDGKITSCELGIYF